MFDYTAAERLVEAAHTAWGRADIDALLRYFANDFEYQIKAGTEDGSPLALVGKDEFADFWRPLVLQMETRTTPGRMQLNGDVARLQVSVWLRHRQTGFTLNGTYRQLLTFRGGLICRIEEYHDAAKLNAFWAVIAQETASAERT